MTGMRNITSRQKIRTFFTTWASIDFGSGRPTFVKFRKGSPVNEKRGPAAVSGFCHELLPFLMSTAKVSVVYHVDSERQMKNLKNLCVYKTWLSENQTSSATTLFDQIRSDQRVVTSYCSWVCNFTAEMASFTISYLSQ